MLGLDSISALLQASVTGAGLVLAIYAVIIPLSRRFSGYRVNEAVNEITKHGKIMDKYMKELGKWIPNLKDVSKEELDEKLSRVDPRLLRKMVDIIKYDVWLYLSCSFPKYLIWGAGATFMGYVLSTLMCLFWFMDVYRSFLDYFLPLAFSLSTIIFFAVGILSIRDISKTMEREFKDILEERMKKADTKIKRTKNADDGNPQ